MSCLHRVVLLLAILACVSSSGCAVARWSMGGEVTRVTAPLPAEFPPEGFSHATFEALLRRYDGFRHSVAHEIKRANLLLDPVEHTVSFDHGRQVELTSIDLSVLDDKGKAVTDLQPSDFSVRVDGSERQVISADWIG